MHPEATGRILAEPYAWMRQEGWTRQGADGWRTPDDRDVCLREAEDYALDLLAVALDRAGPADPLTSPLSDPLSTPCPLSTP